MTEINDINDLIRVLQEHPEWRQALRDIILDERLTSPPQQMDQPLDEVYTQIQQLKTEMAERFNQAGRMAGRLAWRAARMNEQR